MSLTTNTNTSGIKQRISKETFLIESLKIVVDGIARTFGSRCEVVLHDLRNLKNLDHSIAKIANGHVTGRVIGGPISDRGLKDIKSGQGNGLSINYSSETTDGRPLKSSTIMIKSADGKPIASLCINFDVSDIMSLSAVIQEIFVRSEEAAQGDAGETFTADTVSTLGDMIDKAIRKSGRSVTSMRRGDKIEIVRQLEEQGFFLVKGSVKVAAGKLYVSKYTIYNYLEQIRDRNKILKPELV